MFVPLRDDFFGMECGATLGWVPLTPLSHVRNMRALLDWHIFITAVSTGLLGLGAITVVSVVITHCLLGVIFPDTVTVNYLVVVCTGRLILANVNHLLIR